MRTPSGLAYALAARDGGRRQPAASRLPPRRLDPRRALRAARRALRAAAPEGVERSARGAALGRPVEQRLVRAPRARRGARHPARHAPTTCYPSGGRLARRGDGGAAAPVDVVYRRTDEDRLRDDRGRAAPGSPSVLLGPLPRRAPRACVNAVRQRASPTTSSPTPTSRRWSASTCGEEPLIESVPHLRPRRSRASSTASSPRIDELVVKPRSRLRRRAASSSARASARATREDVRREVARARPTRCVAQETVMLSTHPTVCGGRLVPRHVDLRPFVIGGGEHVAVTAPAGSPGSR